MNHTAIKKEIINVTKYADTFKVVIDIDGDGEGFHVQGNIWHDGDFSDFFIDELETQEEAEKKVKKIVTYLKKHFGDEQVEGAY